MSYELRVTSYALRVTSYELKAKRYVLCVELEGGNHE
jgi:hypothetical protein